MIWDHRKEKDNARQLALPRKHVLYGIWMPSDECRCISLAYQGGWLNKSRDLCLVERDPVTFQKMRKNAPNLPSVRCVLGKLETLSVKNPIDYAFLDLYGGVSQPIALFLASSLSPMLRENADIHITQLFARRNNRLLLAMDAYLRSPEGSAIRLMYGVEDLPLQRIKLLLHKIFHAWDFNIRDEKYQDTSNSMLLLSLTGFQRTENATFKPLPKNIA